MSGVQLPFIPKFEQSERIKVLEARNQELSVSGKRQFLDYGDHRCWLNIGPFPHMDKVPSQVEGYRMDCEQWGPIISVCWTIQNHIFILVKQLLEKFIGRLVVFVHVLLIRLQMQMNSMKR